MKLEVLACGVSMAALATAVAVALQNGAAKWKPG
jgi:hypothetical protein